MTSHLPSCMDAVPPFVLLDESDILGPPSSAASTKTLKSSTVVDGGDLVKDSDDDYQL